jgi:hypothetical protein
MSRCVAVWVGAVDKTKNLVKWVKHSRNNRTYYHHNVHSTYLDEPSFGVEKGKDRCACVSLSSCVVIYIVL